MNRIIKLKVGNRKEFVVECSFKDCFDRNSEFFSDALTGTYVFSSDGKDYDDYNEKHIEEEKVIDFNDAVLHLNSYLSNDTKLIKTVLKTYKNICNIMGNIVVKAEDTDNDLKTIGLSSVYKNLIDEDNLDLINLCTRLECIRYYVEYLNTNNLLKPNKDWYLKPLELLLEFSQNYTKAKENIKNEVPRYTIKNEVPKKLSETFFLSFGDNVSDYMIGTPDFIAECNVPYLNRYIGHSYPIALVEPNEVFKKFLNNSNSVGYIVEFFKDCLTVVSVNTKCLGDNVLLSLNEEKRKEYLSKLSDNEFKLIDRINYLTSRCYTYEDKVGLLGLIKELFKSKESLVKDNLEKDVCLQKALDIMNLFINSSFI